MGSADGCACIFPPSSAIIARKFFTSSENLHLQKYLDTQFVFGFSPTDFHSLENIVTGSNSNGSKCSKIELLKVAWNELPYCGIRVQGIYLFLPPWGRTANASLYCCSLTALPEGVCAKMAQLSQLCTVDTASELLGTVSWLLANCGQPSLPSLFNFSHFLHSDGLKFSTESCFEVFSDPRLLWV